MADGATIVAFPARTPAGGGEPGAGPARSADDLAVLCGLAAHSPALISRLFAERRAVSPTDLRLALETVAIAVHAIDAAIQSPDGAA